MESRRITYEEFVQTAIISGCTAISARYRPRDNEQASTFSATVGVLLSDETYSVRSANASRTVFTNNDDTQACPLRFDELVATPELIDQVLAERRNPEDQPLSKASVIVLRCTSCRRSIVVDGVHRLARLAAEKQYTAPVHVLELAGSNWPLNTPDFNIVCVCTRE